MSGALYIDKIEALLYSCHIKKEPPRVLRCCWKVQSHRGHGLEAKREKKIAP